MVSSLEVTRIHSFMKEIKVHIRNSYRPGGTWGGWGGGGGAPPPKKEGEENKKKKKV